MGWPKSREDYYREAVEERRNDPRNNAAIDKMAEDLHIMGVDDRAVAEFLNRQGWTKRDEFTALHTEEDWKLRMKIRREDEAKAKAAAEEARVERIKEMWKREGFYGAA